MQTASRTYNPQNTQTVQRVRELAQKYDVIATTKLHKVRSAQLISLRKSLKSDITILVAKNRIAMLGLRSTGLSNIDDFAKALEGQNALLFTNMNPFKLYLLLDKNSVNLPARAGDLATDDILVPAGNTGLPPGPVLSDFKEANIPTRIDTGSIWVTKDTVASKKGQLISPKLAGLLSRLGIKPIRAGISVFSAYTDGLILQEKDVRLDLEEYRQAIKDAQVAVFAVSIGLSYPIKETMPLLIIKAHSDAIALSIASSYLTAETVGSVLAQAQAGADNLYGMLKGKGYT